MKQMAEQAVRIYHMVQEEGSIIAPEDKFLDKVRQLASITGGKGFSIVLSNELFDRVWAKLAYLAVVPISELEKVDKDYIVYAGVKLVRLQPLSKRTKSNPYAI